MEKTKICNDCNVEKPLTRKNYHAKSSNLDGFDGKCKECKSMRNREWRKKNRDEILARERKYREKNKEKIAEQKQEWAEANAESVAESKRAWADRNPEYWADYRERNVEKVRLADAVYYQENKKRIEEYKRRYYEENKEEIKAYKREYFKNNRELARKAHHRREARKANVPHTLTNTEWAEVKQHFNNSCAYCGLSEDEHQAEYEERLHREHVVPLVKGGGFTAGNIIPACKRCNSSKADIDFEEWYPSYEGYSPKKELFIQEYLSSAEN